MAGMSLLSMAARLVLMKGASRRLLLVDVARQVLFAGAGVAVDEQRDVLVGEVLGLAAQFLALAAFTDEFGGRVDFGFECGVLGL